jgi:hypothetical protein
VGRAAPPPPSTAQKTLHTLLPQAKTGLLLILPNWIWYNISPIYWPF